MDIALQVATVEFMIHQAYACGFGDDHRVMLALVGDRNLLRAMWGVA
jgi:hypothetical protein